MQNSKSLDSHSGKKAKQKFHEKSEMKLTNISIPIKFIEFKISNKISSMISSHTAAISENGIVFKSDNKMEAFTLLRIFIEIPLYWERKAQKVDYRHTEAPSHFQILARVISCEQDCISPQYEFVCEVLNIDPVDCEILKSYLTSNSRDAFL